jgi:riboflavin synthase
MFTGIIEGIGEIRDIRKAGTETTCTIKAPDFFCDCNLGDSIAVDGVCLTITDMENDLLTMYVSSETLNRSTLGALKRGDTVNLERALRLSDRLGGHLVSGHVDGTGVIKRIEKVQRSLVIEIILDNNLSKYLIEKGSIAVDGISLTINRCTGDSFDVTIIPQTAGMTTILKKKTGSRVNIEIDLISKHIEKYLSQYKKAISKEKPSGITRDMLIRYGFGEDNGHI